MIVKNGLTAVEDRRKINVKSNAITAGTAGCRCRHETWRWSLILLICGTNERENLKAVSRVEYPRHTFSIFFFFRDTGMNESTRRDEEYFSHLFRRQLTYNGILSLVS